MLDNCERYYKVCAKIQTSLPPENPSSLRVLNYNTMLLPIYPKTPSHPTYFQNERLADMWQHEFSKYDIITLQEVWGIVTDEVKDACILYAQKAGFFHCVKSENPSFHSLYYADSGLMVFSRYPIVRSDFKTFSLGYEHDADATRGILFAEVKVAGKLCHFFTCHTQCDDHEAPVQYNKFLHELRRSNINEMVAFIGKC